MEVYEEAIDYLQTYKVAGMDKVEPDLIEDVFAVENEDEFMSNRLQAPSTVLPEDGFISNTLPGDSIDLPDTPTDWAPDILLEKRLVVLRSILKSEQQYLSELETLLTPMKALKASAGTSQPVLNPQQVETVFFQVPELREMHRNFYDGLSERLEPLLSTEPEGGQRQATVQPPVGDLFLKMVSQLGVYRGFIDNYESAVEIVRTCTQADQRFRTLAESMMSNKGPDNCRTKYTLEALLYKPLDRVTKTTLVLHDLLKHTPEDHPDHPHLQEALRISSSFLAGVNEDSHCKRAVTLTKGIRRQLMRDGFVVDASECEPSLRHLFLYTDLLLCTKLKNGTPGKQTQYRFSWYLPLAGLRMNLGPVREQPADLQHRISATRGKMFQLREELKQEKGSKGLGARTLDRSRRKLQQCELWLLTHAPVLPLELHSPSGKSHTIFLSSLYELDEWREAIEKLKGENLETVPPDLLALTSSCVKLRMTQQPSLQSLLPDCKDRHLCGTLSIVVHSASGHQEPASLYIRLEVDGYQFFDNTAQTRPSLNTLTPQWDEEFSLLVDGAHCLRLLCVRQPDKREGIKGYRVLEKTTQELDPSLLLKRWKRVTMSMGQVEVSLSLKYCAHALEPPRAAPVQQPPVFAVPIGELAQHERVLVPHIVRSCSEEVERRGLDEVGIYRISGATSDIQIMKKAFDTNVRDAISRLRTVDVNTVSGTLKLYFRELPHSVIPSELFQSLADALEIPDLRSRLDTMLTILQSCPDVNRNTFLFLLHHLKRVAERQEINKMTLMNLATVFGPSMVRPPEVILGQCGPPVDISQEVVVQVQVLYFYLQCQNLPAPQTLAPLDTEEDTEVAL
ncbi:active breakpoint cluster region-related protein isoform X2 [Paramormyrops kingsleyae]|uniref:active breakpoint cluster region-related protein isoform X2 n=1 Tax=Paramormyrops kingsleyae TaxID=1676925 RepID=UPI003B969FBC